MLRTQVQTVAPIQVRSAEVLVSSLEPETVAPTTQVRTEKT